MKKLPNMKDMEKKGYVLIRNYLDKEELETLIADYQRAERMSSENFSMKKMSNQCIKAINSKFESLSHKIQNESDLPLINKFFAGVYFATENKVNYPWHMDHEDYHIIQDLHHVLNFYIPIIKPNPSKSNLWIIPYDKLKEKSIDLYERTLHSGSKLFTFDQKNNKTYLMDTNEDTDLPLCYDFNLEDIAYKPKLNAGDLLLFKCGLIHRTQDSDTNRVALSIRYYCPDDEINLERCLKFSEHKLYLHLRNPIFFLKALEYYTFESTSITLLEKENTITKNIFAPHQFILAKDDKKRWCLYYVDSDQESHKLRLDELVKIDKDMPTGNIEQYLNGIESLGVNDLKKAHLFEIKFKLKPWLPMLAKKYKTKNKPPNVRYTVGGLIDYFQLK